MRHGYFDDARREYVIDKINVPVSWTNYLGVNDLCGVVNHTAGGYLFYKSPEFHRITRFRANAVPMDRPGRYVYVRDDETGDYFSVSWQPVGKPLETAKYECRHGLSYSTFSCEYDGLSASETLFIPLDDPVELWDVKIKNNGASRRMLSLFSYCEFSFHKIRLDNQNFQTSLYASGASYRDGVIEYDLFYEPDNFHFFTSSSPDAGFDTTREAFIGSYRTETNPEAVERGVCSGSEELGGNHCGALHKRITLGPGEEARIIFMLGEGGQASGAAAKAKYSDFAVVDACFSELAAYWDAKLSKLQVNTPNPGMNTMLNIWTLYQSEVNIMFSRFASFIEVGGRTGLGYRDTAQDAMSIPHSNPEKCRARILELLNGLTREGYGLHLFDPLWFQGVGEVQLHPVEQACADDALWLIPAITEYIKETGEYSLVDMVVPYADGGEGTVYEHMTRILGFSDEQVGQHGICKGLKADWNDCLNLGGGESAMVSFLHHWALNAFIELTRRLGRESDAETYASMAERVRENAELVLWDGGWYIRGITVSGRKIGTNTDVEGRVHIESNTWAVLSGVANREHGVAAMDAVDEYLYTPYGLMLNAPAYTVPDEEIGFVTCIYPGLKENAAVFSHPNPWAWAAEAVLGRGSRAMKFYDALCPYNYNDAIETRQAEPYSTCQFIAGRDHKFFGRAYHPFMTGSGGWSYFAATHSILGIRPDYDCLVVDPCIPKDWKEFTATRVWRGATYRITVSNPNGVEKGVRSVTVNGETADRIPVQPAGSINEVSIVMG